MNWEVVYYNENVQQQILDLPGNLKAHYLRLSDLMGIFGPHLKPPHTKAMGNGIYELRLKGQAGIARIFYCTIIGNKIVMLHCFIKKTQKTPRKELETATKRMKEVKDKC